MDGRLAESAFNEAIDSERDADEIVIGIQCHGCDYQLWTHVRPNVPTEVRCCRSGCGAIAIVNATRTMITIPKSRFMVR